MRSTRLAIALAAILALVPATAEASVKKKISVKRSAGTEVRSSPGDWVIGTANNNTPVWVQGAPKEGYRWAFIGGDFNGCAWISQASLTKGGAKSGNKCPAAKELEKKDFIARDGNFIGKGGDTSLPNGNDGRFAVVSAARPGCNGELTAYANVHPTAPTPFPTGPIATLKDGTRGEKGLRWRWVTKDLKWVAVRDAGQRESTNPNARRYSANLKGPFKRKPNNWYFVKRDCLYLAGEEALPRP
jgi:hypothetical protein